jgi:hypothetical protein
MVCEQSGSLRKQVTHGGQTPIQFAVYVLLRWRWARYKASVDLRTDKILDSQVLSDFATGEQYRQPYEEELPAGFPKPGRALARLLASRGQACLSQRWSDRPLLQLKIFSLHTLDNCHSKMFANGTVCSWNTTTS